MGQTSDQIVSDIERAREELKDNLEELETRAKEATDWRTHFNKHPGPMVIAAVIGGALLSAIVGSGSRRH